MLLFRPYMTRNIEHALGNWLLWHPMKKEVANNFNRCKHRNYNSSFAHFPRTNYWLKTQDKTFWKIMILKTKLNKNRIIMGINFSITIFDWFFFWLFYGTRRFPVIIKSLSKRRILTSVDMQQIHFWIKVTLLLIVQKSVHLLKQIKMHIIDICFHFKGKREQHMSPSFNILSIHFL